MQKNKISPPLKSHCCSAQVVATTENNATFSHLPLNFLFSFSLGSFFSLSLSLPLFPSFSPFVAQFLFRFSQTRWLVIVASTNWLVIVVNFRKLLGAVCFAVKYFPKNIFKFAGVCFTVKWLVKRKIISVDRKILY